MRVDQNYRAGQQLQTPKDAVPASSNIPKGARMAPGAVGAMSHCAGIKNDGGECGAPPAKGTAYCAGHLRSMGEL